MYLLVIVLSLINTIHAFSASVHAVRASPVVHSAQHKALPPLALLRLKTWAYARALHLIFASSLPRPVDDLLSQGLLNWKKSVAAAPIPPNGGILRLYGPAKGAAGVVAAEAEGYRVVRQMKRQEKWWERLANWLASMGRPLPVKEEDEEVIFYGGKGGWLGRGQERGRIGVTRVKGAAANGRLLREAVGRLFGTQPGASGGAIRGVSIVKYVFVRPECRGAGWGQRMVQWVWEETASRGGGVLMLTVDDNGSGRLIRYYEANGWVRAEELEAEGGAQVMLQWVPPQPTRTA